MIENHTKAAGYKVSNLVLIALGLFFLQLSFTEVTSFDLFWHLTNGRDMFNSGLPVTHNLHSFTHEGRAISGSYWIYDFLLYLFCGLGGQDLILRLQIFRFFSVFSGLLLFYIFARKKEIVPPLVLLSMVFVWLSMTTRWIIRPEMSAYVIGVFFAIVFFELCRERSKSPFLKTLLVLWVWSNFHMGTAVFGYVLLGGFFIQIFIEACAAKKAGIIIMMKTWLPAGLLALVLSFLTPNLESPVFSAFQFDSGWYAMLTEYFPIRAPFIYSIFGYLALVCWILIKKKEWGLLFSQLVFIYGIWLSSRTLPFLVILSFMVHFFVISKYKSEMTEMKKTNYVFYAVLLLSIVLFYPHFALHRASLGTRINAIKQPVNAVNYMKENDIKGNIFNFVQSGGYITYFMPPDVKVFIDGQVGILYSYEFTLNEYISPSLYLDDFNKITEKYQFNHVLAPNNPGWFPLIRTALLSNLFFIEFADNGFSLLSKKGPHTLEHLSNILFREHDSLSQEKLNSAIEEYKLEGKSSDILMAHIQMYQSFLDGGITNILSPDFVAMHQHPLLLRCAIRLADVAGDHRVGKKLQSKLRRFNEVDHLQAIRFDLLAGNTEMAREKIAFFRTFVEENPFHKSTPGRLRDIEFYSDFVLYLQNPSNFPKEKLKTRAEVSSYLSVLFRNVAKNLKPNEPL